MNNIKNFKDFITENNDNSILLENIDIELILESEQYKKYKNITKKTLNDLKLNLYFVGTFGVSIEAFYPLFAKIIQGEYKDITFNSTQIVLVTICALAVLFNERQEHIKKLKLEANRNGITDDIIDNAVTKIEAFKKFTNIVAKNFNKVIITITDMFAYTAILVPLIHVLLELINTGSLQTDDFINLLSSISIGSLTLYMKHLIIKITKNFTFKISNLFKFQNRDNIKPLLKNDELKTIPKDI